MEFREWVRRSIGIDELWEVEEPSFEDGPLRITVPIVYKGPCQCPVCGRGCGRYDTRTRAWRDLNFGSSKLDVIARFPRAKCPDHGIREIDIPWAGKASRLTLRFERMCASYACAMPVKLASELLDVSDNTIWRIVKHEADEGMCLLDLSDLTEMCVDETQTTKGHSYITIVYNATNGLPIFATEGKDASTMDAFVFWLIHHGGDPLKIKYISTDMSSSFLLGCRKAFPNAKVVVDRFHVMKNANDMVDDVRRGCGIKSSKAKGLRFKFLRNSDDLDEHERARIEPVLEEYEPLGIAYAIKEAVRDFYSSQDPYHCDVHLRLIVNAALDSGVNRVVQFGNTLDRHFYDISQWHFRNISNGIAEGNNSVIQAMKSACRGFKNIGNMIDMIYLRSIKKGVLNGNPPSPGGI